MEKKILVLGATGMFGKPTAMQLSKDGFKVRIMARDVEKAKAMFDTSFEIVQGDVTELDSLKAAMQGSQYVLISIGGAVDRISAENVAALAKSLGVERIGYISGATVAEKNNWYPMTNEKLAAEKAVKSSGVPYTIFCPTWPMEQIARFAGNGKPMMLGKQPYPVHIFASSDLARMISTAFQSQEAENKRLYIYGPQAMTIKEAIQQYCEIVHPDAARISSMPIWMAKLMGTLTRNEGLKFAAGLMGYFEKTPEVGNAAEANQILGKPEITLKEWAAAKK